ncbi:MAG: hypothetical protein V1494_03315 [Candidatus Diapherotrites archaeon]
MAKPIEPTPVLKGVDAQAFWVSLENRKFDEKKSVELDKSRFIYKFFSKE